MITLEGVPIREVEFSYLDGLTITVGPAAPDLNPLFAAAYIAFLEPLTLAARLPDDHPRALTEARARPALAKAYAEGVVFGADDPTFDGYTPAQWEEWLLENDEEFDSLISVVQMRSNFVTEQEEQLQQAAHEAGNALAAMAKGG